MKSGNFNELHAKLKLAASDTPGIHAAGAPIIDNVDGLGRKCWRELAFRLYDLVEEQGVLDKVFPLEAVKEDGDK